MDNEIRNEYRLLYEAAFPKSSLDATFISSGMSAQMFSEKLSISQNLFNDSTAIRQILEKAENRLRDRGRSLRPDAKFFLLTNFLQMVAMPLRFTHRADSDEFTGLLDADINFLLDQASELSWQRQSGEISAHLVIDALSRFWQKLKLSRFRLWED